MGRFLSHVVVLYTRQRRVKSEYKPWLTEHIKKTMLP